MFCVFENIIFYQFTPTITPIHNYTTTKKMAHRTVFNFISTQNWRPVATEILHILNMNRVQNAVVCHSIPDLLNMCRSYEQQVIIWPSLPDTRIPHDLVSCVVNTNYITQNTPFQAWQIYIPDKPGSIIKPTAEDQLIWPSHATPEEKTDWLDQMVQFSKL